MITSWPCRGHAIWAAGARRTFHRYRPAALAGPAPLVVMLHGGFGTGQQVSSSPTRTGWTRIFAAIGPVAATQLSRSRSPAPVSVIHIHGTPDRNVPYGGGTGQGFARTQDRLFRCLTPPGGRSISAARRRCVPPAWSRRPSRGGRPAARSN